jgi:hypothetical protein
VRYETAFEIDADLHPLVHICRACDGTGVLTPHDIEVVCSACSGHGDTAGSTVGEWRLGRRFSVHEVRIEAAKWDSSPRIWYLEERTHGRSDLDERRHLEENCFSSVDAALEECRRRNEEKCT